jgi:hypothetical protein
MKAIPGNTGVKNNNPIQWDWSKARSTSYDDDGVLYKVWGSDMLYNYYGKFFLEYEGDEYRDINDEKNRQEFGEFIYISKWTKDGETQIEELDPDKHPFT